MLLVILFFCGLCLFFAGVYWFWLFFSVCPADFCWFCLLFAGFSWFLLGLVGFCVLLFCWVLLVSVGCVCLIGFLSTVFLQVAAFFAGFRWCLLVMPGFSLRLMLIIIGFVFIMLVFVYWFCWPLLFFPVFVAGFCCFLAWCFCTGFAGYCWVLLVFIVVIFFACCFFFVCCVLLGYVGF